MIYAFQGAEESNFDDFCKVFSSETFQLETVSRDDANVSTSGVGILPLKIVHLTQNYRSKKPIVECCNIVVNCFKSKAEHRSYKSVPKVELKVTPINNTGFSIAHDVLSCFFDDVMLF